MSEYQSNETGGATDVLRFPIGMFCAVVLGYVLAVLTGYVDPSHRLGPAEIGLVTLSFGALLVAWNPHLFENLQRFKLGQLEFDLRKVQGEVDKHRLMLSILLSELQQQILSEVVSGSCRQPGSDDVRFALRGLASQALLDRKPRKNIADISDEGQDYDVLEFMKVTPRGIKIEKIVREILRVN
jgi:hypothetical protein